MIVLDECVDDERLVQAIAEWYRGKVISVRALRPSTLIKDDAISTLLQRVVQPTFVTINVDDFWKQIQADPRYAVVAVEIAQEQSFRLPGLLRQLLRLSEFQTKSARMGKVIRVNMTSIEYYQGNRQLQKFSWSI